MRRSLAKSLCFPFGLQCAHHFTFVGILIVSCAACMRWVGLKWLDPEFINRRNSFVSSPAQERSIYCDTKCGSTAPLSICLVNRHNLFFIDRLHVTYRYHLSYSLSSVELWLIILFRISIAFWESFEFAFLFVGFVDNEYLYLFCV